MQPDPQPNGANTATVTLTVLRGRTGRGEYVFDERSTCLIGRGEDCDPRLPSDDAHRSVSRHHCLLDINPPDVRVRDLGSRNGTFVNGLKIGQREAYHTPEQGRALAFQERDLADGDELRLGKSVAFRVSVRTPAPPPTDPVTVATMLPPACSRCGREITRELGSRFGEYVCADCQAEPDAVLRLLIDLAHDGQRAELAPIAQYTLLRELGRGGMGAVYLARHQRTGHEVALKLMLPKVAANPTARARFLREVELTRVLRHPNIATLYEDGFADGAFFFTSEYCAGGSLDRLLEQRGGRLPIDEALRYTLDVAAGLEFAHGQGVVHRDLSPSNILLALAPWSSAGGGQGALTAKVGDFGLAKAFDHAGLSGLTRTGTTAGKPWYMPRQQVVNFRDVPFAVDVWALAACLYKCLTGAYVRDFGAQDHWHVILHTSPLPIRQREPSVPDALAQVIDHALLEQPAIGFATAREFADALRWAQSVL
ncbi:protein kinase [Actinospica durhamensis]|uniref:non-specific serine/threonine protein kinase n=1 Tax=Actinospica durhamensis TaxID=1508375 RepID=A0A941IV15_9ACTN|nr:protein kinase [Actinospica durhamensis]MBR7836306.1 protein kinase [Actinospica durhamensis]